MSPLSTTAQCSTQGRDNWLRFSDWETEAERRVHGSPCLWNFGMGVVCPGCHCPLIVKTIVQSPSPGPWHSLGPLTVTLSSPLPAPLVNTLKSATSFTRTPLGCRPRPEARQALGLQAGERKRRQEVWVLNGPGQRPSSCPGHGSPDLSQALGTTSCNPAPCLLCPSRN